MSTCRERTSDDDKMKMRAAEPSRWRCCCSSCWLTSADTASTQTLTDEWLTRDEYRLHTSTYKQPTTPPHILAVWSFTCIPYSTSARTVQLQCRLCGVESQTLLTHSHNRNYWLLTPWATIALCAIVARQSTRQFTQRDTHNQNVYIVTMRAGDG